LPRVLTCPPVPRVAWVFYFTALFSVGLGFRPAGGTIRPCHYSIRGLAFVYEVIQRSFALPPPPFLLEFLAQQFRQLPPRKLFCLFVLAFPFRRPHPRIRFFFQIPFDGWRRTRAGLIAFRDDVFFFKACLTKTHPMSVILFDSKRAVRAVVRTTLKVSPLFRSRPSRSFSGLFLLISLPLFCHLIFTPIIPTSRPYCSLSPSFFLLCFSREYLLLVLTLFSFLFCLLTPPSLGPSVRAFPHFGRWPHLHSLSAPHLRTSFSTVTLFCAVRRIPPLFPV